MIKYMRMLVFFDLPVKERYDRKAATQFRSFLLKDGYYMVQFSVYCRICAGNDSIETHEKRLKSVMPSKGSVRLLIVTEKQYENVKFLVGKRKRNDKKINENQVTFF